MTFQTPEQWLASQGGGQQAGGLISPEDWLASQNTGALSPSKPNVQSSSDPLGIDKYVGESAWKKTTESIPVLADMVLGLPAMAYGLATEATSRGISLLTGDTRQSAAERAAATKGRTTEALGGFATPAQSFARGLGATPETSAAGKGMEKFSEGIASGARWLEDQTGGVILKEDAQMLADTLMVGLGFRGMGVAKAKATTPSGSKFSRMDFRNVPKEELRSGKVSPETVDSILAKANKGGGDTITQQDVLTATQQITRGMKDAELNAETLAYDLMQRGAGKKEVEQIRKKNPLVGKKLDELMTTRSELTEKLQPLQGEWLPPEGVNAEGIPQITVVGEPGLSALPPGLRGSEPGGLETPLLPESPPSLKAPEGGGGPTTPMLPPPEGGQPGSVFKGPRAGEAGAAPMIADAAEALIRHRRDLAFIGGGALAGYLVSDDSQFLNTLEGAGLGFLLPRLLSSKGKGLDEGLGIASTRIRNANIPLGDRVSTIMEMDLLTRGHDAMMRQEPWAQALKSLPKELYNKLSAALFTGAKDGVFNVLREIGDTNLAKEWLNVKSLLNDLGTGLKSRGILKNWREDYFPRIVKDREGLLNSLGLEAKDNLTKLLDDARKKAERAGQDFGDVEASAIIDKYLRSPQGRAGVGFLKGRKIGEVTEEMLPFYYDPIESLHTYISRATEEMAMSDFFGKDLKTRDGRIDLQTSIGEVLARELREGRITLDQVPEVKSILTDRFGGGRRGGSQTVQTAKGLVNIGLLGNVVSAFRQSADIGAIAAKYGIKPTVMAIVQGLRGKNPISAKDFGLIDHMSQEYANQGMTSAAVRAAFKGSGFRYMDLMTKTLDVNASLIKAASEAKTPQGQIKLAERWVNTLGPERTAQMLKDLRERNITQDTMYKLFTDLTKTQPVTMMETPQLYMRHPNGRIFYALKTWKLKQADYIRNEAYNEIRKGNVRQGATNLARYAGYMALAGASVDVVTNWLLGKPFDFSDSLVDNLFKTAMWSNYMTDQMKKGKPVEGLADMVKPPYQMADDIISRDPSAIRYTPLIGPLLYSHQFGGKEKAWEKQRKSEAAAKREEVQAMHPEKFARIQALREERKAAKTRKYMEANQ